MTRLTRLTLVLTLAALLALAFPVGALAEDAVAYHAGSYETSGLYYGVSAQVEVPPVAPHVQPGTYSRCYVQIKAPGSTRPALIELGWNMGALADIPYNAMVEYVRYLDPTGIYKVIVLGPAIPGTKPVYRIEWDFLAPGWRVLINNVVIGTYRVFNAPGIPVAQGETDNPLNTMGPSHFDKVMFAVPGAIDLLWFPFSPQDPLYADPPYHIHGVPAAFYVWGPIW